jgi:hypothetical protein
MFYKNYTYLHDKRPEKLVVEVSYFNLTKVTYDKSVDNIILIEKNNALPIKSGTIKGCNCHQLFNNVFEISIAITQEKEVHKYK